MAITAFRRVGTHTIEIVMENQDIWGAPQKPLPKNPSPKNQYRVELQNFYYKRTVVRWNLVDKWDNPFDAAVNADFWRRIRPRQKVRVVKVGKNNQLYVIKEYPALELE